MSVFITGSGLVTGKVPLTDSTATTVLDEDGAVTIAQIRCIEHAGATPNLTIDIYDGTDTIYLRNAVAMTAKGEVIIDGPIVLANDEVLRVTSSNGAGGVHVLVSYFNPSAVGRG